MIQTKHKIIIYRMDGRASAEVFKRRYLLGLIPLEGWWGLQMLPLVTISALGGLVYVNDIKRCKIEIK